MGDRRASPKWVLHTGGGERGPPRSINYYYYYYYYDPLQCHGLWDEDDKRQQKREQAAQETSEDEGNGVGRASEKKEKVRDAVAAPSVRSESRGSVRSLDVDGPVDSVQVQMHHSQQKTFQRRKSSSGGSFISHRSGLSSARSKRGKERPCDGMDGWMDGWMAGRAGRRTDGWMDGERNGRRER